MTVHVTVGATGDDGRVLAVKRATGADDVARLAHEAAVLAQARHPDVVELVSFEVDELRTVFAGSHTLRTLGPVPAERAAGLVAAVAATVADLHEIGVVHGRIEPAHVIVGGGGRPVLCGFAEAGRPGALLPADDVHALGTLLGGLLAAPADDLEPIPDRRFGGRLRGPWAGVHRRALLGLADQATADDPRMRPTARAFAAAIRYAVPDATLGEVAEPRPPRDRPSLRRVAPFAAIAAGLVVLVAGLGSLGGGDGGALFTAVSTTSTDAPTTTTAPASTTTAAAPAPVPTCPAVEGTGADVDGDGCPEAVAIADGVVEVAGVRYQVGVTGDDILLGDWDCDGRATPALLRTATGEVFVFPSWAEPGHDLTVPAVDRIGDARRLVAGSRCAELLVERDDGTQVAVAA